MENQLKNGKRKNIGIRQIYRWVEKYQVNGLNGLYSNTGKKSKYHKNMGIHFRKPKNKIEELELEILKKDIEIARLKKVIK